METKLLSFREYHYPGVCLRNANDENVLLMIEDV